MDNWPAFIAALRLTNFAEIQGEGDGWVAWTAGGDMHVAVEGSDGVHSIRIRNDNVIADMIASAQWVSSLSDVEKDRALAAVECLEHA